MKGTLGLLLTLAALLLAFAALAATTHDVRSGVWTAEIADQSKVYMTIFTGHGEHRGNNMSGFLTALSRFEGLTAAANGQTKFTLRAPAGTLAFDGQFDAGKGAGHFTFTPSDAFVRDMDSLGYSGFRDDELLMFTTNDFSADSLRGLRSMGYEIARRDLDEIAVFHITPEAIREYGRAGYPDLTLREVVNFRVGNVTPEYIREMRDLGYDKVPARELGEMAIMGVRPDYIRELRAAGLTNVPARDLTQLRIGNITAKKIEEYRAAGYPNLTAHELSELGIMNVTPAYIRQMREIGVTSLRKMIDLKATGAGEILLKKKQ